MAALRAVLRDQEALTRTALAALAHAHSRAASAQQARPALPGALHGLLPARRTHPQSVCLFDELLTLKCRISRSAPGGVCTHHMLFRTGERWRAGHVCKAGLGQGAQAVDGARASAEDHAARAARLGAAARRAAAQAAQAVSEAQVLTLWLIPQHPYPPNPPLTTNLSSCLQRCWSAPDTGTWACQGLRHR